MAGAALDKIAKDIAAARQLSISGTPMFLIGRRQGSGVKVAKLLSGFVPASDFIRIVAEAVDMPDLAGSSVTWSSPGYQ
jgi:hypothetical protein